MHARAVNEQTPGADLKASDAIDIWGVNRGKYRRWVEATKAGRQDSLKPAGHLDHIVKYVAAPYNVRVLIALPL
ncbi:hypothetical protein EON62_01355 [archaeon]|nr:MAG: hypothetical protein EON62_01355 [archaeon]